MLFQMMRSLSILVFFACIAISVATEKETACCTEASSKKIDIPITGFRVQQSRPPCVKAVIFYTSKGTVCSHWKETWVKQKVTELRKLQAIEKKQRMTTMTTAPQTTNTTYGFNNTTAY